MSRKRFYSAEKIFKGVANHRRVEMLELISDEPGLSTDQITERLDINYQTSSFHLRNLVRSGLVVGYREGVMTSHELTPIGQSIIKFLKKLK